MQRHELAGNCQLEVLRHELQGVAASAALLLSLDPSHVPLQTKLGTCYLLGALLTSREAAVTLFSDSSGEPRHWNMCLCFSLTQHCITVPEHTSTCV